MRIFTKHFLAAVLLCVAGVVQAAESTVKTVDFSTTNPQYFFDNGWIKEGATQQVVSGEGLTLYNPAVQANAWDYQIFCIDQFNFSSANKYKVKITYKSDVAGNVQLGFGTWTATFYSSVALLETNSYTDVTSGEIAPTSSTTGNDAHVLFQCGQLMGTIVIKKVEVIEIAPDDPLLIPRNELTDAINTVKEVQSKYYTSQSFSAFTSALSSAQSALSASSATVESLNGAKTALNEAYGKLELNPGYHNLTADMFLSHSAQGGDGTPTGCAFEILKSSNMPYGDGNVYWLSYADLSAYDKLIVTVATGTPRFCMNRTADGAQDNGDPTTSQFINIPNVTWATDAYQTKDGDKTFIIDLKKMVAERGIAYLHSMKSYNGNVTVTGMYLFDEKEASEYRPETAVSVDIEINDTDPAIVAKKVALVSAINRGKDADRTNKTSASVKALDDAILEAYKLFAPEAQKKTIEVVIPGTAKQDLTFKTEDYCAAQWTEADKTLSWGTGGWNAEWTFMAAEGVTGDVTEWTKLHLKATDFTNSKENKLKVVFKENDGSNPPAGPTDEVIVEFGEDGVAEIDLTKLEGKCDRTKLQDLTVYGLERTDGEAAATVKVTEAWLEKAGEDKVETKVVDKDQAEILANLGTAAQAIRSAITGLQDRLAPTAEKEVPAGWKSVINNGNLEGSDLSNFYVMVPGEKDPRTPVIEDYAGVDDFHAAVVKSADNPSADWDAQFFIKANEPIPAGKKIHVEFDYRSDVPGDGDTQSHEMPTNYIHWACIGTASFKDEWQHYSYDTTVPSQCDGSDNQNGYKNTFQSIAFNLSKNKKATTFYFDNIVFWVENPDATAITTVETEAADNQYYDLQGRRVAQPGKGLYIVNGKKVLK